jgi:manganese/zinc/iron transport system permease protein
MSQADIEIQLIAMIAAIACALPGVFLVLRRMSLMSDAISHVVLLGIAVGFLITHNLASPLLVVGAAITGVVTVSLVELLTRTQLVRKDAAIGLVFPALFSLGVILIARANADEVHLDTDAVLTGELAFAPFNRIFWHQRDFGPVALWTMGIILVINLALIIVFYKELKIATFDTALAASLGFAPALIHYGLMTMVSVTAVGAFEAVGSILVVALMIAPPASAYLLTDRLSRMLLLSAGIGVLGALGGYWLARSVNASIAGSMATVQGIIFACVFSFAPGRGLFYLARRSNRQRIEFARKMLAIHLLHHENSPAAAVENRVEHLSEHLRWTPRFAETIVTSAERNGFVQRTPNGHLTLTPPGRALAQEAVVNL